MYRLRVKYSFDAAHSLLNYEGKCANLHGHTWQVEVFLTGNKLNNIGMLIDFSEVKQYLYKIIDKLDHTYLNDVLKDISPTCENLSKYIYKQLKTYIKAENVRLQKVRLWESESSWCEYFEN